MTTFLGTPGFGNLRGEEGFPAAARRALRNAQIRRNVGHATRAIRTKRLAAVAECPDWEQLRSAGSALKQDVLARLPELLEELEANVVARGGQVHWARDAAEANPLAPRALCDMNERSEVGTMMASEVPTERCMRTASST